MGGHSPGPPFFFIFAATAPVALLYSGSMYPDHLKASILISVVSLLLASCSDPATLTGDIENQPPLSIQEEAKLRGVDFLAVGQEPPWRLEISAELILLTTGYEQTRHEFPMQTPQSEPAAKVTRYQIKNTSADTHQTSELSVVIEGKECSDSMSGLGYAATVTAVLDGQQLRGCGQALH
jgi:uncharacterized membrane protein